MHQTWNVFGTLSSVPVFGTNDGFSVVAGRSLHAEPSIFVTSPPKIGLRAPSPQQSVSHFDFVNGENQAEDFAAKRWQRTQGIPCRTVPLTRQYGPEDALALSRRRLKVPQKIGAEPPSSPRVSACGVLAELTQPVSHGRIPLSCVQIRALKSLNEAFHVLG
jgi:hypothetical protein